MNGNRLIENQATQNAITIDCFLVISSDVKKNVTVESPSNNPRLEILSICKIILDFLKNFIITFELKFC